MKIDKVKEIVYLMAFSIYCIVSLLGASELILIDENIKNAIYIICSVLFLVVILTNKYTIKEYVIYTITLLFTLYASIQLHKMLFFINVLAIMAIKGINFKKIIKTDIIIKIIILSIHTLAYIYQYTFDYVEIQNKIIQDLNRNRHALYFSHPNLVSQIVLWLAFDILYLKKCNKNSIIVTIAMIIIIYIITDSRTMLMSYVLFLVLYYSKAIMNTKIYNNIINFVQKIIIDGLSILSFLLSFLYKYNFNIIGQLNRLTSGRVYYSFVVIEKFGIHLLPNTEGLNIDSYIIIDNFYIKSFILFGAVFIILLSIMTKLIDKKENNISKIIIILFAVNLFSEYSSICIGNAIPLLLMGNIIVNENRKRYSKEKNNILEDGKEGDY